MFFDFNYTYNLNISILWFSMFEIIIFLHFTLMILNDTQEQVQSKQMHYDYTVFHAMVFTIF